LSKVKLMAARELIKAKQYDEARSILKTVNHPTARSWLEKLDEIAPVRKNVNKDTRLPIWLAFSVLGLTVVIGFLLVSRQASNIQIARIELPSDGEIALQERINTIVGNPQYSVTRSQKATDPSELTGIGMMSDIPDELWCVSIDIPVNVNVITDALYEITQQIENVQRFVIYREGLLWNAVPSDTDGLLQTETGLMIFELETVQSAWLQAGCEW